MGTESNVQCAKRYFLIWVETEINNTGRNTEIGVCSDILKYISDIQNSENKWSNIIEFIVIKTGEKLLFVL